jgi:colanic acid biosynthesis glycosyl transferase WcaI
MHKRILLLGYNFYPEPTGIGKYSGEMMFWLARNGHDCSVLTTYPYYPYWQVQPPYVQDRFQYTTEQLAVSDGRSLEIYRVPMYVPAAPTGLKRILLDISFSISAALKLAHLFFKKKQFDCVIVVAPSFQFGILGILCKKLWKAKFIYHIQDLQIEAARDLKLIKSQKVIGILFRVEKYIFSHADIISSISDGMIERIACKARKEVIIFPNWADVTLIHPLPDKEMLRPMFGFAPNDRIILYSGAIGEKQGLEAIMYAARKFTQQPEIKFVICGSGPYEKNLRELAVSLSLPNVFFLPLQPLSKLNSLLNSADIHLVIQKANASDLVMPSKLTNILSVGGVALITADTDSGLFKLIKKHEMGLVVPAEDQEAFTTGLQEALLMDPTTITKNARTYAEHYLAVDSVMRAFEKAILTN